MSLMSFLYLNEPLLDTFLAQLEDGVRQTATRTSNTGKSGGGGVDFGVAQLSGSKNSSGSTSSEYRDSGPAKFKRLVAAASADPDEYDWREVVQESDMQGIRRGFILDIGADLQESDATKAFGANGVMNLLPMMKAMQKFPGTAAMSMPSDDQVEGMTAFGRELPGAVVRGEILDTSWLMAASLSHPLDGALDGEVRVVGKVTKVIGEGRWEPLPGMPVISQMNREMKREFERTGPKDGSELLALRGPAVLLDVLAIVQ